MKGADIERVSVKDHADGMRGPRIAAVWGELSS